MSLTKHSLLQQAASSNRVDNEGSELGRVVALALVGWY